MTTTDRHEIDFDHHSSEFRDQCPAVIAGLHASGRPLGWSDAHGGFWAIYGYDAALRRGAGRRAVQLRGTVRPSRRACRAPLRTIR